jgi:hypothetical protein
MKYETMRHVTASKGMEANLTESGSGTRHVGTRQPDPKEPPRSSIAEDHLKVVERDIGGVDVAQNSKLGRN